MTNRPEVTKCPDLTHKGKQTAAEAWYLRDYKGCHFAAVWEVVSRPDRSQSGRLRHSSASLVDFRGRRAAAFLLCPLMCKIWAFRYFWPNCRRMHTPSAGLHSLLFPLRTFFN